MSLEVEIRAAMGEEMVNKFDQLIDPDKRLIASCGVDKNSKKALIFLAGVHDYLTDDADFEGQTVFLEEEIKNAFINLINKVLENSSEPVDMRLAWSGDSLIKEVRLNQLEIIANIKEDKLYNRCKYIISKV